jgi:hypothetical protein
VPRWVAVPVGVLLGQIKQPYLSQTRGIRLIRFLGKAPEDRVRQLSVTGLDFLYQAI